nr:MAG TPA_asm: hypothetical protein [Caudoviricetes sp.]
MSNSPIPKQHWDTPQYSKRQINNAGKALSKQDIGEIEKQEALEIVNNWRSSHAYPLSVITNNLRRNNKNALVVQRLKRLDSITSKLKRNSTMELYRMQDLGGCRVIVDTIDDVYNAEKQFEHSSARHIKKGFKDYIQNPKTSGYRCFHAIYKYHSDKVDTYNKNMLIEIQFRTKLQHIWATALETMGLYEKQNFKASQGDENVLRFFMLMSSIFALVEGTPVCPDTSDDFQTLVHEVQALNKKNKIFEKLHGISSTVKKVSNHTHGNAKYFLLKLEVAPEQTTLYTAAFPAKDLPVATKIYNDIEQKHDDNIDIVLVSANDVNALRTAYPNYFADISSFLLILHQITYGNASTELQAFVDYVSIIVKGNKAIFS